MATRRRRPSKTKLVHRKRRREREEYECVEEPEEAVDDSIESSSSALLAATSSCSGGCEERVTNGDLEDVAEQTAFETAHAPALAWSRELARRQAANPLYLPATLSYRRRVVPAHDSQWDGKLARYLELRFGRQVSLCAAASKPPVASGRLLLCATLYMSPNDDTNRLCPVEAARPIHVAVAAGEEEEGNAKCNDRCALFCEDISASLDERKDCRVHICLQLFDVPETGDFCGTWPACCGASAVSLQRDAVLDTWPVSQQALTSGLRRATHALLVPLSAFTDSDSPATRGGMVRLVLEPRSNRRPATRASESAADASKIWRGSSLALRVGSALKAVVPSRRPNVVGGSAATEANDEETRDKPWGGMYCFHLLFRKHAARGEIGSRLEFRQDATCPWCDQYCGPDPRGLLAHLNANHTPALNFQALSDDRGALHILAAPYTLQDASTIDQDEDEDQDIARKDFVFVAGPDPPALPVVPIATGRDEASMRLAAQLAKQHALPSRSISQQREPPPQRQYYHSRTCEPLASTNLLDQPDDYADSDDEVDEQWRLDLSARLIDEFEDVTPPEKLFMKLWNAFVFRKPVLADRALPKACLDFATTCATQLLQNNLRHNFLLHLFHLWDNSLLAANHISACLDVLDQTAAASSFC